jgi:hypothetical protein
MRSKASFVATIISLFAFALAGCSRAQSVGGDAGGDGDTDADTDGDIDTATDVDSDADTDTGTSTDPWEFACDPSAAPPCADTDGSIPAEYERYVDLGAMGLTAIRAARSATAILAETETSDGAVAPVVAVWRLNEYDDVTVVGLLDATSVDLHAVDIASPALLAYYETTGLSDPYEVLGYAAAVLLCAGEGNASCALYGLLDDAWSPTIGLAPIPGGEVPLGEADAVAWDPPPEDGVSTGRVCAAGDGVACFDGDAWTVEVLAGGPVLRAITSSDPYDSEGDLYAAGDGGRVVSNRGGAWEEIETGASISFTSVSAWADSWAAGGDGGFVFGDGAHVAACLLDVGAVTAVYARESSLPEISALSEGRILEVWNEDAGFGWCARTPAYDGVPRNAGNWPFVVDAAFGYALTSSGLYLRFENGGFF